MPERQPGKTFLLAPDLAGVMCRALLEHAGAPSPHARIVSDHLLEASLMGLHSHGIIRVPQYLDEIANGELDPAAEAAVTRPTSARLNVDGHRGFGQVVGMAMVDALEPVAREAGVAIAVGRHLGHTGRIGAYPEALAVRGLIGVAFCGGPPSGHWVAPFGGREGRIPPNPIAFAYPVAADAPVVGDFSTSATAEGVVRSLRNRGLSVPEGMLRDAAGLPTTDPNVLYGSPRGAIQAFGGPLGYRGTAMALLVEVLASLLAGDDIEDITRRGSNLAMVAVLPGSDFPELAARMGRFVRSSPPIDPARPVLMPGDRERLAVQAAKGIEIDPPTWEDLSRRASAAGVPFPEPLSR